jgi:predicted MFS family arabinose efflux permease
MDFMIMMPMAPQLMRKLHILPDQFSLLVASYTVSAGIASFLGTFFVDRFDRKKVLLTCYAGFIAGSALCGLAPDYHLLLAARIATGLLGGIIGSQVLSIVGDVISPANRGKATGYVMTGFSAASVLGVPVGLYFATVLGWEVPFFGISGLGVLVFFVARAILPPIRKHLEISGPRETKMELIRGILSFSKHRIALMFTVCVGFSHFTIVPFLSPYMVSNVGFSEIDLSYIYIIGGALTLFTGPFIGRLADRYGTVRVFTVLVVVAVIPLLGITHLGPVPLWQALILTSLFFVFSGGRFVPSQSLTISAVENRYRGGFMSLNSSVMQLASGLAAFLAGKVVEKDSSGHLLNYGWTGYFALGFGLVTLWMARQLRRDLP